MAIRSGRLSNDERLFILQMLGEEARRRYDRNLITGGHQYNLKILKGSLQFAPDVEAFQNVYWIDTGSRKLNEIANYFEYGTGMYNTQRRGQAIKSKTKGGVLKFRKAWHGIKFATSVSGVKPVFMKARAEKSIENERNSLQREIRLKYGF